MTVSGVLWRFLLTYIILMIAAVVGLRMLGISSNSGVNTGVLIGAVLWPCMAFAMKNKRYFTSDEKPKVVWGMIAINLLLQLVVGGSALAAEGKMNVGVLAIGLAFVGVLHSIAIYYFVGVGGKLSQKQLQQQVSAGGQP